MESISRFITQKLKLKVNEEKSAVAPPQERKFLGFSAILSRAPERCAGIRKRLLMFANSSVRRVAGQWCRSHTAHALRSIIQQVFT